MNRKFISFLALTLFILSCSSLSLEPYSDDSVLGPYEKINGTVNYINIEGGLWAITTDSLTYQPINLPEIYHHKELDVSVEFIVRYDIATIHMVGPVIHIHKIQPAD